MTRHFQTVARESSSVPQDEISDAPDEGRFTRRRSFYCIVLLTLTAAVLRISFLGSKSLWYDESLTEYRVTLPFVSLVKVLAHGQMNMGLYYLLLHGWTSFAGSSEFMLRLPSAIFAVATVPLVYALGVELRDRRTGLLAALLVTVNATCIRYAQNARSYSLMIALCTLAAFFYVRGVKRGGPASLLGYVVSATGSVYAHLFGVMALPAQWLSLFLFRPDKKTRIILTACIFTIGLLVVPAFFFAITGDHGNDSWVHRTSPAMVAHLPFLFAGEFDGRLSKLALLFTALYLIGIALAVVRASRPEWPMLGFLLLSICLPIGMTIAISLIKPLFVIRYQLPALPFFALLAAIGLLRLKRPLVIAMAVAIALLSLAEDYSYYRAPSFEDWRGTVDFVALHAQPGDRLLIFPPNYVEAIDYYVARLDHPETFPTKILQTAVIEGSKVAENPEQLLEESDIGASRRIWLAFPVWSPLNKIPLQLILPKERVVDQPKFSGLKVFLLERSSQSNFSFRHF